MWEIAPGFRPNLEGLTAEVKTGLDKLGEKVRAAGGRLLLTSAYRPGGWTLHGQGKAVDVWVPGWTHERIAEYGQKAGFVGGYIPRTGNFVELVTDPYFYSVPGRVFGFDKYLAPAAEERTGFFERARDWAGERARDWAGERAKETIFGERAGVIPEINWHQIIIILSSVVIIIILISSFVKGGEL